MQELDKLMNFLKKELLLSSSVYDMEDTENLSSENISTLKELDAYLRSIAQRLLKDVKLSNGLTADDLLKDMHFYLIDDLSVNAGYMKSSNPSLKLKPLAISKGLLKFAQEDEARLAAVLAHELGHVLHEWMHNNNVGNTKLEENSADILAVEMMHKAGYNPKVFLTVLNEISLDNKLDSERDKMIAEVFNLLDTHPLDATRQMMSKKYLDLNASEIAQTEKEGKYTQRRIDSTLLFKLSQLPLISQRWQKRWENYQGGNSFEDFVSFLPSLMTTLYKTEYYRNSLYLSSLGYSPESLELSLEPQKGLEDQKVMYLNPACQNWIKQKVKSFILKGYDVNAVYERLTFDVLKKLENQLPYEKNDSFAPQHALKHIISRALTYSEPCSSNDHFSESLSQLRDLFKQAVEDSDHFDEYLSKIKEHPLLQPLYQDAFFDDEKGTRLFVKGMPFMTSPYLKPMSKGEKLPWAPLLEKLKTTTDEEQRANYLKVLQTIGVFPFSFHHNDKPLGRASTTLFKDPDNYLVLKSCSLTRWSSLVNDFEALGEQLVFQQVGQRLYAYRYDNNNQVISVKQFNPYSRLSTQKLFLSHEATRYYEEVYRPWFDKTYQLALGELFWKADNLSQTIITPELMDDLDAIINFSILLRVVDPDRVSAYLYDMKKLMPQFAHQGKEGPSGDVVTKKMIENYALQERLPRNAGEKYLEIAHFIVDNYQSSDADQKALAQSLLKKITTNQGFWRIGPLLKTQETKFDYYSLISKQPFESFLQDESIQKILKSPYQIDGVKDVYFSVLETRNEFAYSLFKDVLCVAKASKNLKRLIYDVKGDQSYAEFEGYAVYPVEYGLYFTEMIEALLDENSQIPIQDILAFHSKLFHKNRFVLAKNSSDNEEEKIDEMDQAIDDYIAFIGKDKIEKGLRYHIKKCLSFSQYPDVTADLQEIEPFLKLYKNTSGADDKRGFKACILDATNEILSENVKKFKHYDTIEEARDSALLLEVCRQSFQVGRSNWDINWGSYNELVKAYRNAFTNISFTPSMIEEIFEKESPDSVFNRSPEYYVGLYCLLSKKKIFPNDSPLQTQIGFHIASLIEQLPKEKQEALCFEMLRQSVKIENYELIRKLTTLWSQSVLSQLGKTDDRSESYRQKVLTFIEKMRPATKKDEDNDEPFLPVRTMMGKQLQDDLVSQYELSMDIDRVSGNIQSFLSDQKKTEKCGFLFDFFVYISKRGGSNVQSFKDFLLSPFDESRLPALSVKLSDGAEIKYKEGLSPTALQMMYEDFWQLPFEVRSLLIYNLYNGMTDTQQALQTDLSKYLFDESTPQIMHKALYNYARAVPEDEMYRAEFLLCDCLAVSKPTNEKSSPAKVLKLFLEAQGAAGIKIGQFLSARRELPEDVRQELLTLTNRASTPSRADIFKLLENYHPEILKEVKQNGVGRILGAASHYITLDLNDKEVLSVSREKSGLRADSIFKRILKAIDLTMQEDREYRELLSLFRDAVEQAYSMNDIELDGNITIQQNLKAIDIFDGIQVKSGLWAVDFNVMKPSVDQRESNLTRVEISHDTGVYYSQSQKIIQKSNGYSWFDLEAMIQDPALVQTKYPAFKDFSHQELEQIRQSLAEANFMVNLRMLLKGDVFDDDRHSGQFNFNLKDDKTLQVDLYDFGALSLTPPSKKELNSLGRLIMKTYLDYQKMIQEGKQDVSLISLFTQAVSHEKQALKSEKIYLSKVIRALGQLEHFGVTPKQIPALLKGVIQDIHPQILVGMAETYMDSKPLTESLKFSLAKKMGATNQIAEKVKQTLHQELSAVMPLSLTQTKQHKPTIHTYPTTVRGPVMNLDGVLKKGKEAYTQKESAPKVSDIDETDFSMAAFSISDGDIQKAIEQHQEDKKKKIIQNIESYRASQKQNEAQIILSNKSYMALCRMLPQEMKACEKEVLENQELKLYVSEKYYQKVLKALKEKQLVFKVVKPLFNKATKKASSLKTSGMR